MKFHKRQVIFDKVGDFGLSRSILFHCSLFYTKM